MASDSMRVRLHLRETRVLAVVSDTPNELRVDEPHRVLRRLQPLRGWSHDRTATPGEVPG